MIDNPYSGGKGKMNEHLQKPQKEPYEKPAMVTERLETGALASGAGSPIAPPPPTQPLIGQVQPFFGLCCG